MVSGSPASSSTKTVNHVIVEILLKAALEYQQSNQIIYKCMFAKAMYV